MRVSDSSPRLHAYLHQLKGKALMKDAVDAGSPGQLQCVYLISGAFNSLLKVHSKLLDHPSRNGKRSRQEFSAQPRNYTKRAMSSASYEGCELHLFIGGGRATVCEWGQRALIESVLSFHRVGLGDKTQAIRLGSKPAHPLGHLSPVASFLVFHGSVVLEDRVLLCDPDWL